MEERCQRAYRSAYRRVETLQIELARHVYSVERRREAERRLREAMNDLDRARGALLAMRHRRPGGRNPQPAAADGTPNPD